MIFSTCTNLPGRINTETVFWWIKYFHYRNMKPSVMYLIEVLIMLSEDEHEKIVTAAEDGLKLYSERCEASCGKSFLEILEDNFYNLVTKLPRILHGTGTRHFFAFQG
jgi:hypothetical protein